MFTDDELESLRAQLFDTPEPDDEAPARCRSARAATHSRSPITWHGKAALTGCLPSRFRSRRATSLCLRLRRTRRQPPSWRECGRRGRYRHRGCPSEPPFDYPGSTASKARPGTAALASTDRIANVG